MHEKLLKIKSPRKRLHRPSVDLEMFANHREWDFLGSARASPLIVRFFRILAFERFDVAASVKLVFLVKLLLFFLRKFLFDSIG
ncbi:hypothetical protein KQI79_15825 [Paenibacillus sp. MSJ-34]|nr:hypothetical protein [Paenibacillus sp. MSJ-34]